VLRGVGQLPNAIFHYVFAMNWPCRIALMTLTVVTFLPAGGGVTADATDATAEHDRSDSRRTGRVLPLDMGIYKLKLSMRFLMNLCSLRSR